jgi:trehalose 6-phosphate synthase
MVNAMWDGMNLVSKEGPLVNQRDGLIMLSENTGAHEELGHAALSVNPFDVQEQADTIHRALTASQQERRERTRALHEIITARSPVDWIDDQLADIEAKRAATAAR